MEVNLYRKSEPDKITVYISLCQLKSFNSIITYKRQPFVVQTCFAISADEQRLNGFSSALVGDRIGVDNLSVLIL